MHPLDEQLTALVQRLQLRTTPPLEAEVLSQTGRELELRLLADDATLQRWELKPGVQGVPLALQGCWAVQLAPGARVVLEWLDGDPRKPLVRTIVSGTIVSATLAAQTVDLGGSGATVVLAGGAQPVIRAGDTPAGLTSAAPGSPVTGSYGALKPGKVLA